jgi:hypothetical protein
VNEVPTPWARRGRYLGTEIDGKWWRRYRGRGFFARGSGRYWSDAEAFRFLRYLTRTPLEIPFARVSAVEIGSWHAGRWTAGIPIVKIIWGEDGHRLSSGFVVSGGRAEVDSVISEIRSRMRRRL